MASDRYEFLPLFCLRLAGRPFDHLEKLKLHKTLELARALLEADRAVNDAAERALAAIRLKPDALPGQSRNKVGQALGLRQALPLDTSPLPEIEAYRETEKSRTTLAAAVQKTLEEEFAAARTALIGTVEGVIKPFAVFSSGEMNERVQQALEKGAEGSFDRRARERERHLLLYLQRICAKNDTISEFGPTAWGRVDPELEGARIVAEPGIAQRDLYLEKWVADGVAEAITNDARMKPEISPRVHPNGLIEGDAFVRLDSGARRVLTAEERALFDRCDGRTPAFSLGSLELLEKLAADGVIIFKLEPIPFDPHRMELLLEEVKGFRPSAARDEWVALIEELLSQARAFGASTDPADRFSRMETVRDKLQSLEVSGKQGRRLYAATNPIGEDCVRKVDFAIGRREAEVLARDAAPWFDLWCDIFAYAAGAWGTALAEVYRSAPRTDGKVLLPAFMAHCERSGLPISSASFSRICQPKFVEARALFAQQLADRKDAAEWELTEADCHVIRRKQPLKPFGEVVYPSVDLMLQAESPEAVGRGDYDWIISELHPGGALLDHAISWGCPDKRAFGAVYGRATDHVGLFNYAVGGSDPTSHTTTKSWNVIPQQWTFVSPARPRPEFPRVLPTRAEVVLSEDGPDVRLRSVDDGRDLGSFVRHWGVPTNSMHPFMFVIRPQMPRLRMGKVIVQRRFWTVSMPDLQGGPFQGLSARLVAAVERLRAEKGLPRFVYARPSVRQIENSLERDKDTKPIFVDLESYHSLDVFQHALSKHGEMELSEMLPAPEKMVWREKDGRYAFEIRGLTGRAAR